jgi:hypothetical protein
MIGLQGGMMILALLIGGVLILTGYVIKRLTDQDRNLTRLQKEMEERRMREQAQRLRERERQHVREEKTTPSPEGEELKNGEMNHVSKP